LTTDKELEIEYIKKKKYINKRRSELRACSRSLNRKLNKMKENIENSITARITKRSRSKNMVILNFRKYTKTKTSF